MTHTTAVQPLPAVSLPLASSGYDRASTAPTPRSMASATIHEAGSTGIASTAEDIGLFIRALLDPPAGFLSARAIALMREPQIRNAHGFVGLGLYAPVAAGANAFVGHDGGSGGLHGTLGLIVERRLGVFVFYNSTGIPNPVTPEGELFQAISARYFADAGEQASRPAEVLTGVYEPTRRTESNLFKLGALLGQLRIDDRGDGRILLNQAFLPFGGITMHETSPGLFTARGLEVSFAASPSGVRAQIGAPVAMYRRVRWWRSAQGIVPVLLACVLLSVAVVVRSAWRVVRRRASGLTPGRLSLLLNAAAIAGALWLISAGRLLAVTAAPSLTIVLLAIYIAAWGGAGLAVASLWHTARSRHTGPAWREVVVTIVALMMSAFCIGWRIAGTSLAL
jgi:hypothetical protein